MSEYFIFKHPLFVRFKVIAAVAKLRYSGIWSRAVWYWVPMLGINIMPASSGSKSPSIGPYVVVIGAAVPFELLVLSTRRHCCIGDGYCCSVVDRFFFSCKIAVCTSCKS